MNTLKNISLGVILIITLITFIATSCQTPKVIESPSCCTKKATVDKCAKPSQKSECCKKK
jgi:hypothetical protein